MKILVTGATGNIGRMVVDHLLARGATDVRALTVDPARAALPDGVEAVRGYLRQVDTLGPALAGVDRMYLAPAQETVPEVLRLAREAGVRHVVDLSGEPDSWWGQVTAAVEAGGVAWTHLWPGDFMENLTIWAPQIRETGTVREPYPEQASAPIAMDDIAEVAAAVLLEDGHEGKAYTLAGPETLTRKEMLRHIGRALGRDLEFIKVGRDEAIEVLTPVMGGNAEWYVDNALPFGWDPGEATGEVERLTSRPATTFADWVAKHKADFA